MKNFSKISLFKTPVLNSTEINIPGSKSESNRALILNALAGDIVAIKNLSDARDTRTMIKLLSSGEKDLDVLDAGTTMRFLTAYFSATKKHKVLTGTTRMKERPISILVDALREIGVDISYNEKQGFPPIEISAFEKQKNNHLKVRGDVSSQYISALLMIAAKLPQGLEIELQGDIGSRPYIQMTLGLMEKFGIQHIWNKNSIYVGPQAMSPVNIHIEPDWSGASYWYAFVALSEEAILQIPGLRRNSFQGDRVIADIAEQLGIQTKFSEEGVILTKTDHREIVELDFTDCPDLAQTVAVICAAKNINGKFTGLKSLRIKETDRIKALQVELQKINADLNQVGEDEYDLLPSNKIPESAVFDTYEDHRMAMAFAPLSTIMDVEILDPGVVDKSYPTFWEEVRKVGIGTDK